MARDLRNWFYNSAILPHKKLVSFILGFLSAVLPQITGLAKETTVAGFFLAAFVILLIVLLMVRPSPFREIKFDRSRWGILSVSVLGYGLAAFLYHYREWLKWLWYKFREINEPPEWILVSLFLLGVILGFFVVRNWSKNQQDFITSLTAVLGAAFLATILGTLANAGNQANTTQATQQGNNAATSATNTNQGNTQGNANNGNRANGNAANGNLTNGNLSNGNTTQTNNNQTDTGQTNTNTTTTNATQASTTQGSTAKPLDAVTTFAFYGLGFTLSGVLNLIAFSLLVAHYSRTQSPNSRSVIDFLYGSDKAKAIDGYFLKNFEEDPNYAKVKLISALVAYREVIKTEFARKMSMRKRQREMQSPPMFPGSPPLCSDDPPAPPLDYFELVSIENRESKDSLLGSPPIDPTYEVIFRRLQEGEEIRPDMFRAAISMRWQDNLEYVVAPGEYKKSFPYYGSVAGMALAVRKTIVMDRDRFKEFRTQDFVQGKTPNEADQPRGLYRADFLSYISMPMASSFGKEEETGIGVLHIDTKLFACPQGQLPTGCCRVVDTDTAGEFYRVERKQNGLNEFSVYACNLYEQNDHIVLYLESMRGVIVPLLELYKKCRTGGAA